MAHVPGKGPRLVDVHEHDFSATPLYASVLRLPSSLAPVHFNFGLYLCSIASTTRSNPPSIGSSPGYTVPSLLPDNRVLFSITVGVEERGYRRSRLCILVLFQDESSMLHYRSSCWSAWRAACSQEKVTIISPYGRQKEYRGTKTLYSLIYIESQPLKSRHARYVPRSMGMSANLRFDRRGNGQPWRLSSVQRTSAAGRGSAHNVHQCLSSNCQAAHASRPI